MPDYRASTYAVIDRYKGGHGPRFAQLTLDTDFYRLRWDRATSAEKDYLRAMAVDGDAGTASGEVAARLGKKVTALGPVRAKLIDKGLFYAPDRGVVAYTVPAMSSFIERQVTDR